MGSMLLSVDADAAILRQTYFTLSSLEAKEVPISSNEIVATGFLFYIKSQREGDTSYHSAQLH